MHLNKCCALPSLTAADRVMDGGDVLQPGVWRARDVSVGRHAAPAFAAIAPMLERWGSFYSGVRRGELQVLAAHRRLAWIRPFWDGNGRVARLHTHLVLGKRGLLATDSPHGKLRLGVPQHALRLYFPSLWPEAEVDT